MTKTLTPYEDINRIVLLLLRKSQKILNKNIVGMYLHGSLATGTFDRKKGSDIDFVIVLKEKVQENMVPKLKEMVQEMTKVMPELSKKLEGSYVPKKWFSFSQPPNDIRPYVNEGELRMCSYGYEWILEKYLIKTRGITVFGPSSDTFIKSISQGEIKRANINILIEDWEPLLKNSKRLKSDIYRVYAVLTMCRSLFLSVNKRFPSKPEAALWARKQFPQWKNLIDATLNWYPDQKFEYLDEILAFIKFTIKFVSF